MNTVVNLPQSTASDAAVARPAEAQHAAAGADANAAAAAAAVNPSSRRQQRPAAAPAALHSPFVPILLGSLALLGWLGFQTYGLVTERSGLASARTAQTTISLPRPWLKKVKISLEPMKLNLKKEKAFLFNLVIIIIMFILTFRLQKWVGPVSRLASTSSPIAWKN